MIHKVEIGDTVSFTQENGVEVTFRFGTNSTEVRTGTLGTRLEMKTYDDFAAICKGINIDAIS
jgi:hypothetical protein